MSPSLSVLRRALIGAAVILVLAAPQATVLAATITVDSTADAITLLAGTYTISIAGAQEDAGVTGDLDITNDLAIAGAGASATIVDGGALDRVFHVHVESTVEISGVTIRNGSASDAGLGLPPLVGADTGDTNSVACCSNPTPGGGISNAGALSLADSEVTGNRAGFGGGISNTGTLVLNNSTVSGNTAASCGGGITGGTSPAGGGSRGRWRGAPTSAGPWTS